MTDTTRRNVLKSFGATALASSLPRAVRAAAPTDFDRPYLSPDANALIKQGSAWAPIILNATHSVGNVCTGGANPQNNIRWGSFFCIGVTQDFKQILMTNKHVIEAARQRSPDLADLGVTFFPGGKEPSFLPASVVNIHRDPDMAILESDVSPAALFKLRPAPLGSSAHLSPGSEFMSGGFPKSQFCLKFDAQIVKFNSYDEDFVHSPPDGRMCVLSNIWEKMQADNDGISGGLLLDKDGNVIGMNAYLNDKVLSAIPVEEIVAYATNFFPQLQLPHPNQRAVDRYEACEQQVLDNEYLGSAMLKPVRTPEPVSRQAPKPNVVDFHF